MADLPFPLGFDGTEKLPRTLTTLVNCWNAGDKIINRPGITQLNTNGGLARGVFGWNDNLYMVASTNLIKITNLLTGAFTTIGTISGVNDIDVAIGFNHAVIIVKGGNGYTLNSSDTLTVISDPDFKASDSVAHINGRFVYIPTNGDPAIFSEVGDGADIDTLSFFDAEQLPDKNKINFNFGNRLYIGGTDSFEVFKNPTTGTITFARLDARINYGYIGGKLEYNLNDIDTWLFIGRKKDQTPGIYAIAQGRAVRISNELIDTALETYTTAELSKVKANRIIWLGYDIATFKLPRHSFGLENGNWFELSTQVNNTSKPWAADHFAEFQGQYYVGHEDKIGVFADVPGDYGNTFEKRIEVGFEQDRPFTLNSLQINISQGFNAEIGSVSLELSDDNVLYGPAFSEPTGALGEYYNLIEWDYPGGLGYYEGGFAGLRIRTTENINFSATKLIINQ